MRIFILLLWISAMCAKDAPDPAAVSFVQSHKGLHMNGFGFGVPIPQRRQYEKLDHILQDARVIPTAEDGDDSYSNLVGVDPRSIVLWQQHRFNELWFPSWTLNHKAWSRHYIKLASKDFKQWVTGGFPKDKFGDGMFIFTVMHDENDIMRITKVSDSCVGGHSSAVSQAEYEALKRGDIKMTYAGTFAIQEGNIMWWSNNSGHFQPNTALHKIFGKHWGLQNIAFLPYETAPPYPDCSGSQWSQILVWMKQIVLVLMSVSFCAGCVVGFGLVLLVKIQSRNTIMRGK